MPQLPFAVPESSRQRWQFSIRGMLLFTASVAVGISVWQTKLVCWSAYGFNYSPRREDIHSSWSGGLIAFFLCWMLFGLGYQIRDLWAFLGGHPHLDQEQRRGLRFEIFWRVCVVLLLTLIALFAALLNQGFLILPEIDWEGGFFYGWGESAVIREAILILLVMTILGSIPHAQPKLKRPCWQWLINFFTWALAITICLIVWMDEAYYVMIGHFATVEMDRAFPLKYSAIDPLHYRERCLFFYHWAIISGAIVLFNWICLSSLARQWSAGIVRRCLWALLFLSGITAVGSNVIWIFACGLRQISLYFAEVVMQFPTHYWIAIGLLLTVLITVMTYQMAVNRNPMPKESPMSWRRNTGDYFHEGRYFLLGLAVAIVAFRIYASYEVFQQEPCMFSIFGSPERFVKSFYSWPMFVKIFFYRPMEFLWTGLLMLVIFRAFAGRSDANQLQAALPRLNRAKFITIWLATAALVVSGTLALVWMSFSLWLTRY
jgi:hypothetical protein